MKQNLLVFAVVVVASLFFARHSWTACPQDPSDLGICDTLYVETFGCDNTYQATAGYDSVRVAIYVTHDSNTFYWDGGGRWVQDSIAGFLVPLTFWKEDCADSVILPTWDGWNNTEIIPYDPVMERSMFGHQVDPHAGQTVYNRLFQMAENGKDAWSVITNIESHSSQDNSGHVYLNIFGATAACQRWWEGSRVLLATLTFLVYMDDTCDITEICLDSTFWYPSDNLSFVRLDGTLYCPRHFLPVCDTIYSLHVMCGDCNEDGEITSADVVCLINYLFIGGPPPSPLCKADAIGDNVVNAADVICLINYLFIKGPPPSFDCCACQKVEKNFSPKRIFPQKLRQAPQELKLVE
jgi:hypothetical protein